MDETLLLDHIRWAEGLRLEPYRDSVGKITIGYGRNLDDKGIRQGEAEFMLRNDVQDALKDARTLPYWDHIGPVRQMVIADMVFNMGLTKLRGFVNMNLALEHQDYNAAAFELKDSKYYRDRATHLRASRNYKAMLTGIWEPA